MLFEGRNNSLMEWVWCGSMIIYFIYSRKIHLFQLSVFTDVNIGNVSLGNYFFWFSNLFVWKPIEIISCFFFKKSLLTDKLLFAWYKEFL